MNNSGYLSSLLRAARDGLDPAERSAFDDHLIAALAARCTVADVEEAVAEARAPSRAEAAADPLPMEVGSRVPQRRQPHWEGTVVQISSQPLAGTYVTVEWHDLGTPTRQGRSTNLPEELELVDGELQGPEMAPPRQS
jgi:hypothetical protein